MNLIHDLARLSKERLKLLKVVPGKAWDDRMTIVKYLDICQRMLVPCIPRKIEYSDEFPSILQGLSDDELTAFHDIEKAIRNGEQLDCYMSSSLRKTNSSKMDHLASRWEVYHLHLEKKRSSRRFNDGNGKILFFIPTETVANFITIKPHPRGSEWFDRNLLETAHSKWPHLFPSIPGITQLSQNFSDQEIYDITRAHVNVGVPLSYGVVLGNSTSMAGTINGLKANRYCSALFEYQRQLERLQLSVGHDANDDFQLIVEKGFFYAMTTVTQEKIPLFDSRKIGLEFCW